MSVSTAGAPAAAAAQRVESQIIVIRRSISVSAVNVWWCVCACVCGSELGVRACIANNPAVLSPLTIIHGVGRLLVQLTLRAHVHAGMCNYCAEQCHVVRSA